MPPLFYFAAAAAPPPPSSPKIPPLFISASSQLFHRRISSDANPPKTMEEKEVEESAESRVGFNKTRAAGKEKGDKLRTLQLKTRKLNPVNTISYVQGLQRFCTEHKIKLSKIDHIFLTRVCSETTGGLPGLLLTLAGMGDEGMSVNVWGPFDLKYLIDAMTFIPNAAMVHTHKFGP